jgi:hypothetical protein
MIRISVIFKFLLFAFVYFNIMLSLSISFLFLFLLVFVLLERRAKGLRCSDGCSNGEFDSCVIHAHVTLLREGACTNSISTDD